MLSTVSCMLTVQILRTAGALALPFSNPQQLVHQDAPGASIEAADRTTADPRDLNLSRSRVDDVADHCMQREAPPV